MPSLETQNEENYRAPGVQDPVEPVEMSAYERRHKSFTLIGHEEEGELKQKQGKAADFLKGVFINTFHIARYNHFHSNSVVVREELFEKDSLDPQLIEFLTPFVWQYISLSEEFMSDVELGSANRQMADVLGAASTLGIPWK